MAALTVIAVALAVMAAIQVAVLALTWGILRRMDETLRQVAAAAESAGRAARHVGELAASTRNLAEGAAGMVAYNRLARSDAGGAGAVRAGLELGTAIWKALAERRRKTQAAGAQDAPASAPGAGARGTTGPTGAA